jgi:Cu+-exporting ATPase
MALSMPLMPGGGARRGFRPHQMAAWAGRDIFSRARVSFRNRTADMNTLIALGTGAAFFYAAAVRAMPWFFERRGVAPEVCFEAVAMIIAPALAGSALESRARGKASAALKKMLPLQPAQARVVREGAEIDIAVEQVREGGIVLAPPGERVPLDGVVTDGARAVDESMLTGEPVPVSKAPGDKLIGGTLNRVGSLCYRAEAPGSASMLAQIVKLMREALRKQARLACGVCATHGCLDCHCQAKH